MKNVILFLAILGLSASVFAREHDEYERCIEDNPSTVGMHQCMKAEYEVVDKELNDVYRKLKKSLLVDQIGGKELDKRLVTAQRAWLTFRDANCDLQAGQMLGGTGEGSVRMSCTLEMTRARVGELKDLAANLGGI